MNRLSLRGVAAVAVVLSLLGCTPDRDVTADRGDSENLTGTLSVLAAASLTEVMETVATAFERTHPGVRVDVTFDGSARLATEIIEGVPADVFVAADEANLARVADADLTAGRPRVVATNVLQIVVPIDNPHGIRGLADLGNDVVVAMCRAEVPCGAYAEEAFRAAGLDGPPAGRVDNVKSALAKVQLGEADAGLVYRTDVLAATGVTGIDLGPGEATVASYPATVLAQTSNRSAAEAFVRFLVGAEAQTVFASAGFGAP